MRIRRILTVAAMLGIGATAASAQIGPQEYLQFAGVHSGSTGPYYADVMNVANGIWSPTGQRLTIFCVDYHHAVYGNSRWQVNTSWLSSGSLGNTRLGAPFAPASPNTSLTGYTAMQRYTGAAYLAWMMEVGPKSEWRAMHQALWQVTSQQGYVASASGANTYYTQALAVMNGQLSPTGFNVNDWAVLTDVVARGDEFGIQEYIVSVPEPGTTFLMASGLLLLVGVGRSRRAPPEAA